MMQSVIRIETSDEEFYNSMKRNADIDLWGRRWTLAMYSSDRSKTRFPEWRGTVEYNEMIEVKKVDIDWGKIARTMMRNVLEGEGSCIYGLRSHYSELTDEEYKAMQDASDEVERENVK